MERTELEALSTNLIDHFNTANWDAYKNLLTTNCTYAEYATGQTYDTAGTYIEALQAWKTAFPNVEGKVTSRTVDTETSTVTEQVTWHGTHTGPMTTPDGQTIPPTNKTITINGCMVTSFANNQVTNVHNYFCMFTMMTQLGLMQN